MGLDVSVVNFCCLPRPGGITYDFVKKLNENADCSGYSNAYSLFYKDDVAMLVEEFCKDNNCSNEEKNEIMEWVEDLPWEENEIVLNFNW